MDTQFNRKEHWEKVYATKSHREVSWYTDHLDESLSLIQRFLPDRKRSLVDVGGGASTLVDDLLDQGYQNLSVLDISSKALSIAQHRLGENASKVQWICGDVISEDLELEIYDAWHDRAVFHFMTTDQERQAYRKVVLKHLREGGIALFSIFAEDGPEKCSGVFVKRNTFEEWNKWMGSDFELIHQEKSVHHTPSQSEQRFQQIVLRKRL